jgi:protein involved in polysaccharide export with SLBB domain
MNTAMNSKRSAVFTLLLSVCFLSRAWGQFPETAKEPDVKQSVPRAMNFSNMFQKESPTREELETLRQEKELKIRTRMSQPGAIEKAVDPRRYLVGPGDGFSFNVWGAMETQQSVIVNPEGKLLIPSLGEISVDGESLEAVQLEVIEKAKPHYGNSRVTLTLESLRFFHVYVVGEVRFPGAIYACALDRVPDLIAEAGGVTDWAWTRKIELRRIDGGVCPIDLAAFEAKGDFDDQLYVRGGDVVYVPPVTSDSCAVTVEGDLQKAGLYAILPGEDLLDFLQRIRVLTRSTDLSEIAVLRQEAGQDGRKNPEELRPLATRDFSTQSFALRNGDRIVLPCPYVYVKGTVASPGAYPYSMNLTAKDYAGMAGGDFHSGRITKVTVYHARTGKTESGPNVVVSPGDVVHLNITWNERFGSYLQILSIITSLIIAAKAAGFFGQ